MTDGEPAALPGTVFVCTSCAPPGFTGGHDDNPGLALVSALQRALTRADVTELTIAPVECLAVCKRPCTIALKASGKWTYLIGDLDPAIHADDIIAGARAYVRSENGIVAWRERPQCFRKGVIARVPPLGFVQPIMAAPSNSAIKASGS